MTKKEFTEEVAKRCMLTPYVVDEIYNVSSGLVIEKLIASEGVELPYLGKYKLMKKGKTTYKNLFGSEEKTIDESYYPTFHVTNNIKNRVKTSCNRGKML